MLILAKSILGLMLGFFGAIIVGWFLIPLLRKLKFKQSISSFTAFRHASKNGTPTIGGLIFIIPTLLGTIFLALTNKITYTISHNKTPFKTMLQLYHTTKKYAIDIITKKNNKK